LGIRRSYIVAVFGVILAVFGLAAFRTYEIRLTDQTYDGGCEEHEIARDGESIRFEAACRFWAHRFEIKASSPITEFSSELSTERDALLFGGGGPDCQRSEPTVVTCDGEVDRDEHFTGSVKVPDGPCQVTLRLAAEGGGCSDIAYQCDDLGIRGSIGFRHPTGCGA
jgi:hypothetical protein